MLNPIVPKEKSGEQIPPSDELKVYEDILQNYEHPSRLRNSWPFDLIRRAIAKAKGE